MPESDQGDDMIGASLLLARRQYTRPSRIRSLLALRRQRPRPARGGVHARDLRRGSNVLPYAVVTRRRQLAHLVGQDIVVRN